MTTNKVVHPLDMTMYKEKYTTRKMREIFSEEGKFSRWLRVEAVVAIAQSQLGIIPSYAADEIEKKANLNYVKIERLAEIYNDVNLDTVALVKGLAEACDKGADKYVHWGLTTTDIMDTGLSLQLKDAVEEIFNDMEKLELILLKMAEKFKDTLMIARTHSQHALPITFGFKLAMWAIEVSNHIERLLSIKERLLVGKITGAVGSQASFVNVASDLQKKVCNELLLNLPDMNIQISRLHITEFLFVLSLIGNTIDQIAKDIWNKQRPELGELQEPFILGKNVGSSTLAFKRNPFNCEWLRGMAKIVRANTVTMMEIIPEDERDGTRYPVEYSIIPESCLIIDAMINQITELLRGLKVNKSQMFKNIELQNGVVMSEAIMMKLAESGMGRQEAHTAMYYCSSKTYEKKCHLKDILIDDTTITKYLSEDEIVSLLKPENYLGTIPSQIEDTLKRVYERREKRQ